MFSSAGRQDVAYLRKLPFAARRMNGCFGPQADLLITFGQRPLYNLIATERHGALLKALDVVHFKAFIKERWFGAVEASQKEKAIIWNSL